MAIDQYTLRALTEAFAQFGKYDLSVSDDAALLYDALKGEGVNMGGVALTMLRAALEKGDVSFGGETFSIKDSEGEEILDVSDIGGEEAKISVSPDGYGTHFITVGWKLEDDDSREYTATNKLALYVEY